MMKKIIFVFACSALFGEKITPQDALNKLIEGNLRVVKESPEHPNRFKESLSQAMALKQEPFAVIVACADSRVSPELVFDQGIGDLFVVRVAGNVIGLIELESIHYAVTQLKAPIILVMGHENCGAVQAVLQKQDQTIPEISALIKPAIESALGKPGNPLQNAVEANVKLVVEQLREVDFISKLIKTNELGVVGSYYHIQNGSVIVL